MSSYNLAILNLILHLLDNFFSRHNRSIKLRIRKLKTNDGFKDTVKSGVRTHDLRSLQNITESSLSDGRNK